MSSLAKLLFIFFLITSVFLFYPKQTSAETHKQSTGVWQLMTIKNLLIAEQAKLEQQQVLALRAKRKVTPTPTKYKPLALAQTPVPTPTPKTQTVQPTNEVEAHIMQEINNYRTKYGLAPVQTSAETCNFARIRADEITRSFSHDGFYSRSKNKTMPYNNGSRAVENLAHAYNYKDVVQLWADSPTHAQNMKANTPYVCVAKNGDYYAYEGLTP